MSFSENLKALLDHRNIRQTRLTEILGITKTRVSNYLSGRSEPDYDTLVRIADFFNITVDSLLDYRTPSDNIPLIFDYGFPKISSNCPEEEKEKYIPVYKSSSAPLEEPLSPTGYIRQNHTRSLYGYYALIISDNSMHPYIKAGDTVYVKPCRQKDIVALMQEGSRPICTFSLTDTDPVGVTLKKCLFKKNMTVCVSSVEDNYMEIYNTEAESLPLKGMITGIWRSFTQKLP